MLPFCYEAKGKQEVKVWVLSEQQSMQYTAVSPISGWRPWNRMRWGNIRYLQRKFTVRKGQNKKGSQTISNGSVIHVYDNQFMMLVDGGKIIDYTAEPGYFTVDQSSSPSMFIGSLDAAVKDTFERLKFGGQTRMSREFSILICRKSRESNSEREIRSTISTSSTMPSCSFGHTVPIPSTSSIRSAST